MRFAVRTTAVAGSTPAPSTVLALTFHPGKRSEGQKKSPHLLTQAEALASDHETDMTPSIRQTGDGRSNAVPSITPHSKSELEMSDSLDEDAWRDVRVWLHHSADGTARLITCFERQGEDGYEYVVVDPESVQLLPLDVFHDRITSRRQEVSVREEWKRRIWDAYRRNPVSVRGVMRDLKDSDVAEVVAHG